MVPYFLNGIAVVSGFQDRQAAPDRTVERQAMAETLVNLTSFKLRVSTDAETVGGPIDVALISKGDGLVWINRKHYFEKDLNYSFFMNYRDAT